MTNGIQYHVAILGATGAVGRKMLETLVDRNFPMSKLTLLSSKRSAGTTVSYKGKTYTVEEASEDAFNGVDIALFSAGGDISKQYANAAVLRGAVVIDNTSAYRMDESVPLVVPEVNESDIKKHQGIIANPNCSTIQMVVALAPLRARYGLREIIVSTYQAVSGAGAEAINELETQTKAYLAGQDLKASQLPVKGAKNHYPIAFNVLPQIDTFTDNGYTFEEMKMINETKKIMHDEDIKVAATCVRLPIVTSHSESVYVLLEKAPSVQEIKEVLKNSQGVTVKDDPENQIYPTPKDAEGLPDVFVGRIRQDLHTENGYHLFIVSDNLLKGAAFNSVQIAESLIKNNWL